MLNHNESASYVNFLMAEHCRLHRMLRMARQAIVGDREANALDWTARIVKVLGDVRSELQCHFSQEEEGGCLGQAVSFQPQLSPNMKHIEEEHPLLLAAIDRLVAQAQDCTAAPADRMALELAFDELCRDLHAHEAAENELLRKGLGADMEGEENGAAAALPHAHCAAPHDNAQP